MHFVRTIVLKMICDFLFVKLSELLLVTILSKFVMEGNDLNIMDIIAREGKWKLYKLPGVVMMNSASLVRCAFRMRYTCFRKDEHDQQWICC